MSDTLDFRAAGLAIGRAMATGLMQVAPDREREHENELVLLGAACQ